jgi:hypothetical protein
MYMNKGGAAILGGCALLAATAAEAAPVDITVCRTISAAGIYRLQATLRPTGNCLVVSGSFITIDLNGFALIGRGQGVGITDTPGNRKGIVVRNGSVSGFYQGIVFQNASDVSIENVRVIDNGFQGIELYQTGSVTRSVVTGNGGTGIGASKGGIFTDNQIIGNRYDGLATGPWSVVRGNVARGNGGDGINGIGVISGNTVYGNGSYGIRPGCPSSVIGNIGYNNGYGNILVGTGCTYSDNAS